MSPTLRVTGSFSRNYAVERRAAAFSACNTVYFESLQQAAFFKPKYETVPTIAISNSRRGELALRRQRARHLFRGDGIKIRRMSAVDAEESGHSANQFLSLLNGLDFLRLDNSLKRVSIERGTILCEPWSEIDRIYFPHNGMISLLAVMNDGRAIETATLGREGAVGLMAGLGLHASVTRAVAQVPLVASQIAAAPFRRAVQASNALRELIVRHEVALLAQVQTTAACNALHTIEERLARWILQARDRCDGDAVPLTQELLSEMLGVRRTSITEVASRLQAKGLIRYSRGVIDIVDGKQLEQVACECYGMMRDNATRILT